MSDLNIARPSPALAASKASKTKGKVWGRPFQPGRSGNPGGKSKQRENIVDIARNATPSAIKTLVSIMENENAPFSVRAYCADKVIDRAWGKPAQQTNLNIGTNMRSLRELSDQELMSIIEAGCATPALSPPVIEQQPAIDVEPEVQPTLGVEPDEAA